MTQAIYNAQAYARQLGASALGECSPDRYWASFADRASAADFARWLELHGTRRRVYGVKGGVAVDFWDQASKDRERAAARLAARVIRERFKLQNAAAIKAERRRAWGFDLAAVAFIIAFCWHPLYAITGAILVTLLWIAAHMRR